MEFEKPLPELDLTKFKPLSAGEKPKEGALDLDKDLGREWLRQEKPSKKTVSR